MTAAQLWKSLSPEQRRAAAEAFWRDEESWQEQMEAVVALAQRLKFRPKSMGALPVERRVQYLAQTGQVSDSVAARALVAYHLAAQRPMMGAFLDAVGLPHEDGLITDENPPAPDPARLPEAVSAIRGSFPPEDVDVYLRTLVALDGDTWVGISGLVEPNPVDS